MSSEPKELVYRKVVTKLSSQTPYYQSRRLESTKPPNEDYEKWEPTVWKERCHTVEGHRDPAMNGHIYIPPQAFKESIVSAAKFLGEKVPGGNGKTWTKQFKAGVLVLDALILDCTPDSIKGHKLYLPHNGQKGGNKRVLKIMPRIDQWEGSVTWFITSQDITDETFERVLKCAGCNIGIGAFRRETGLHYGAFSVESMKWGKAE